MVRRFRLNPLGVFRPARAQEAQGRPPGPSQPAEKGGTLQELASSLADRLATAMGLTHQRVGTQPQLEKSLPEPFLDEEILPRRGRQVREESSQSTLSTLMQTLAGKLGNTPAPASTAPRYPEPVPGTGPKPPPAGPPPLPVGPGAPPRFDFEPPTPPPLLTGGAPPPLPPPLPGTPPPLPGQFPAAPPVRRPSEATTPPRPLPDSKMAGDVDVSVGKMQGAMLNQGGPADKLGQVGRGDEADKRAEKTPESTTDKAAKAADLTMLAGRAAAGDPTAMLAIAEEVKKKIEEKWEGLKEMGSGARNAFAGETVGEVTEGAGEMLQGAGKVFGSESLTKAGEFVEWLGKASDQFRTFVSNLEQSNFQFGEFSSSMAAVQAYSEVLAINRSMIRGEQRAGSAMRLTESRDRFERAINPIEDKWAEFKNSIMATVLEYLAGLVDIAKKVAEKYLNIQFEDGDKVTQQGPGRMVYDIGMDWWKNFNRPDRFPK